MKLISSRIRDYKCIEDSDRFTIGPVTCLVGKNEAGKTAILEALHKLKPDVGARFSDLDFPRRKWQPKMDTSLLPKNVVETEWEVEDADREALFSALGIDPLKGGAVVVKCVATRTRPPGPFPLMRISSYSTSLGGRVSQLQNQTRFGMLAL